jgi:hypothetical protein
MAHRARSNGNGDHSGPRRGARREWRSRGPGLGEWGSAGRVLVAPATRPKPNSVSEPERSPAVDTRMGAPSVRKKPRCAIRHHCSVVPVTWFKVDDSFHSHPKVLATDADALGLWVVAGAWSSSNLTDGFVPTHALLRLIPGSDDLARKLVTSGLWRRTKGGYQFHDWLTYQPSKEEATAGRDGMSTGGALGNHRRWHIGTGKKNASCRYCQGKRDRPTDRVPDAIPESPPNPPGPSRPLLGGALGDPLTPRAGDPPSPRCERHQNADGSEPCGACRDARQARTRWDMADAERRRNAPKCRRHRGQPADNCALCRSEALADQEAQ